MSVLPSVALMAAISFVWMLPRWRWSACTCGRQRLPWFARRHERQWILWAYVALLTAAAMSAALSRHTAMTVTDGLFLVYALKVATEHRKGKRSVLGRLLGRVTFNAHGRLVVEQMTAAHNAPAKGLP